MPLDVKLSIDIHQQGHYFGNRRGVLQWLYNDFCSYRATNSKRRLWISEEIPSVTDVVEKYPALTTSAIAQTEFHLLAKVQLVDALGHSFAAAAAKIVDAARKKRHLDGFMKELVDRADYALEAPKNNVILGGTVLIY
ncbi:hypothetical protein MRX96_003307 [Rhipicephalus microplus]